MPINQYTHDLFGREVDRLEHNNSRRRVGRFERVLRMHNLV